MNRKLIAVAVSLAFPAFPFVGVRAGLVPVADKLDAIPEGQRGWYVEKEGKFHLDPTKVEFEDVGGLKSALEKERTAKATAEAARKALAAQYEGIDPVKYREIMSHFESTEETELLKKGKEGIDAIISKRTEKLRQEYEKKFNDAEAGRSGALEVATKFMERVLDNHVRAVAMEAGVHPSAIDDVLIRARGIFDVDDEGEPVQLGEDEQPVMGKDGKTPFSPKEWLEGMKEKAPHWFPADASGGGAGGKGKGAGGANTISRASFEAKTPEEKTAFIKGGGKVVD